MPFGLAFPDLAMFSLIRFRTRLLICQKSRALPLRHMDKEYKAQISFLQSQIFVYRKLANLLCVPSMYRVSQTTYTYNGNIIRRNRKSFQKVFQQNLKLRSWTCRRSVLHPRRQSDPSHRSHLRLLSAAADIAERTHDSLSHGR